MNTRTPPVEWSHILSRLTLSPHVAAGEGTGLAVHDARRTAFHHGEISHSVVSISKEMSQPINREALVAQ